jgi:hypothetical protein
MQEPPGYATCDQAVMKIGGATDPKRQFAQPLLMILLFHRRDHAGALISFGRRHWDQPPPPIIEPITISASRSARNAWEIAQIGYQF